MYKNPQIVTVDGIKTKEKKYLMLKILHYSPLTGGERDAGATTA
jgi:hypothetical protein